MPRPRLLPMETERLRLRALTAADVPALAAYRADERVARLQSWREFSQADARALVDEQAARAFGERGQWVQVAIALRDSDALIGDIGVHVNAAGDAAEIGFSLAPDAQGKGYAAEALRAVVELLFTDVGVRRIEAVIDARNDAAIALVKRLGMTLERTEESEFKGERVQEHRFALWR